MKKTPQEQFWSKKFGAEYLARNPHTKSQLDSLYKDNFGITRSVMNKNFLSKRKINNILEVGCNVGAQLDTLSKQGFKNLYGIEINIQALKILRKEKPDLNAIEGSTFNLPFRDNFFDLVFTSGVLIHISPEDITRAMDEIYRVSKKYIWGFEYYSTNYKAIEYRGNKNRLWKAPFTDMYLNRFPDLKLVKKELYPYKRNVEQKDIMFLLEKK